jgi:hypothetical protein
MTGRILTEISSPLSQLLLFTQRIPMVLPKLGDGFAEIVFHDGTVCTEPDAEGINDTVTAQTETAFHVSLE